MVSKLVQDSLAKAAQLRARTPAPTPPPKQRKVEKASRADANAEQPNPQLMPPQFEHIYIYNCFCGLIMIRLDPVPPLHSLDSQLLSF